MDALGDLRAQDSRRGRSGAAHVRNFHFLAPFEGQGFERPGFERPTQTCDPSLTCVEIRRSNVLYDALRHLAVSAMVLHARRRWGNVLDWRRHQVAQIQSYSGSRSHVRDPDQTLP